MIPCEKISNAMHACQARLKKSIKCRLHSAWDFLSPLPIVWRGNLAIKWTQIPGYVCGQNVLTYGSLVAGWKTYLESPPPLTVRYTLTTRDPAKSKAEIENYCFDRDINLYIYFIASWHADILITRKKIKVHQLIFCKKLTTFKN